MPQPPGLQVLPEGPRDQRCPVVRQQLRAVFGRDPIHSRRFARQLHHLAESIRAQGGLKPPGQDLPAKIVQHRDQVVPPPPFHQKVRSYNFV